jgi:hypothetical protein
VQISSYHCHYNPVELIWPQVKSYVAEKSTAFKMADIQRLTHEAVNNIQLQLWWAVFYKQKNGRKMTSRDRLPEMKCWN